MAWLRKEVSAVAEIKNKLEALVEAHTALATSHMALQAAHMELHAHVHAATVPASAGKPSQTTAQPHPGVHPAGVKPVTQAAAPKATATPATAK